MDEQLTCSKCCPTSASRAGRLSRKPLASNPSTQLQPLPSQGILAPEEAPDHTRGYGASKVRRRQGRAGQVGGLAELVAPGEGERVGDGEDEGDGCVITPGLTQKRHCRLTEGNGQTVRRANIPTKGSQISLNRISTSRARPTHSSGWT